MQIHLSPAGHLFLAETADADAAAGTSPDAQLHAAFQHSQEAGLIALAARKGTADWTLPCLYWRDFAAHYLMRLCRHQGSEQAPDPIPAPDSATLAAWHVRIPPMPGAEYCSPELLADLWRRLDAWVGDTIAQLPEGRTAFLRQYAPAWHQVGRVCFHLAENTADPEYPFAFMATYVSGLGKNGRSRHLPLHRALSEYAGANNRTALLHLLAPVHEASRKCAWVEELVATGDIYHPLAWTPQEAWLLLQDIPALEESGLVVRLPDWWKKRPRPRVQVQIGGQIGPQLSAQHLLSFAVHLSLDGEPLSEEERAALLATSQGLCSLRGQWVEVDGEKLRHVLEHWHTIQATAGEDGISFIEGMRLLAGADRTLAGQESSLEESGWALVEAGEELRETLARLRDPDLLAAVRTGSSLRATLRPYQQIGLNWLWFLAECGLGACLADDMGLGKTVQVIALMLAQKEVAGRPEPNLLVLPASLLGNWKQECARFAPSLRILVFHPSEMARAEMEQLAHNPSQYLQGIDTVITTYALLQRLGWLKDIRWNLIVLDEAQAIKNPATRQAKAAKALPGRARIVLTGTPVENRLTDLWSLFDFLAPGLLGTAQRFKQFTGALAKRQPTSYAPLRKLVQPYILRRLKTDKAIINDLPDKIEMAAWCGLSKAQAVLYEQTVQNLADNLRQHQQGIKRRGMILSALLRFKQICNHPDQVLGDGEYAEEKSGKFARLRDLCEEIASRQDKVLVFTQFREMTLPLADFLLRIFGRPGLVLHGGTAVAERHRLVERFQAAEGPPFLVLSLKAGGTGLNLTAASHVIHFDRWWNPAVENQATDRAFRLGQKKNVLVHKFICKGTVEEKIDALIAAKAGLADALLTGGGEALLTEMDDQALIQLVRLDLTRAAL